MKKYMILALTAVLAASLLAGCRNPNLDMDTNPGDTSTPTGTIAEPTTQRATQPQTTAPTTMPHINPTTETPTTGTADPGSNASPESRFRRRMPGM